jgi:hypothetical protein
MSLPLFNPGTDLDGAHYILVQGCRASGKSVLARQLLLDLRRAGRAESVVCFTHELAEDSAAFWGLNPHSPKEIETLAPSVLELQTPASGSLVMIMDECLMRRARGTAQIQDHLMTSARAVNTTVLELLSYAYSVPRPECIDLVFSLGSGNERLIRLLPEDVQEAFREAASSMPTYQALVFSRKAWTQGHPYLMTYSPILPAGPVSSLE